MASYFSPLSPYGGQTPQVTVPVMGTPFTLPMAGSYSSPLNDLTQSPQFTSMQTPSVQEILTGRPQTGFIDTFNVPTQTVSSPRRSVTQGHAGTMQIRDKAIRLFNTAREIRAVCGKEGFKQFAQQEMDELNRNLDELNQRADLHLSRCRAHSGSVGPTSTVPVLSARGFKHFLLGH